MITKLIGMEIDQFISMTKLAPDQRETEICAQEARLIPWFKDEASLTSVFLSSIKLIKEFQRHFLDAIDLPKGKIYVFREVNFKKGIRNHEEGSRLDGLLLVVKGNRIVDAVFFEMKSKNNQQCIDQIQKYSALAEILGVNKVVTISNFLTSNPTFFPLDVRISKKISVFHFSWEYVMTVARMFLHPVNGKDIEDNDQKEIMREVLMYLEHSDTGSTDFSEVRKEWREYVEKRKLGLVKKEDDLIKFTVESWSQLESHMALYLSSATGEMVSVVESKKHKDDYFAKLDDLAQNLFRTSTLSTSFKIKNAVSDLTLQLSFISNQLEISLEVPAHPEKKNTGKISHFLKEMKTNKDSPVFASMSPGITIDIVKKGQRENLKLSFNDLASGRYEVGEGEIKEFRLNFIKTMVKQIETGKVVADFDQIILDFYNMFVENFKEIKVEPARATNIVLTQQVQLPPIPLSDTANVLEQSADPVEEISASKEVIDQESCQKNDLDEDQEKIAS